MLAIILSFYNKILVSFSQLHPTIITITSLRATTEPTATNPDHKHFGSRQLIQVLAETNTCPLEASIDRLVNKLETWCSSTGPKDDVSTVAMEIM
jgi:hypothetical protein